MKSLQILVLVIATVLVGCNPKGAPEIQVFQIDSSLPEQEIKISDIMEVERLIVLKEYLPAGSDIIPTSKYIVAVIRGNSMRGGPRFMQFSYGGEYIRDLALFGRGPGFQLNH